MEGLYLLKQAAGQDNEVNEAIHIKYDPEIFMGLGHAASTEPGVWLWESLRHRQRKKRRAVSKTKETQRKRTSENTE